jgi:hypothetical protein
MDTGTILSIILGVIGIILTVAGFMVSSKKNKLIIKPKTKNGNINFNNSTIGNEISNHDNKM